MSQKYKSNGNGFVNLSKSGQKYPQDRTSKRAFNSNQSQQNSNININNPEINFGHNQIDPPKININFEEDIASHLINLNPEGNPNLEKKNKKIKYYDDIPHDKYNIPNNNNIHNINFAPNEIINTGNSKFKKNQNINIIRKEYSLNNTSKKPEKNLIIQRKNTNKNNIIINNNMPIKTNKPKINIKQKTPTKNIKITNNNNIEKMKTRQINIDINKKFNDKELTKNREKIKKVLRNLIDNEDASGKLEIKELKDNNVENALLNPVNIDPNKTNGSLRDINIIVVNMNNNKIQYTEKNNINIDNNNNEQEYLINLKNKSIKFEKEGDEDDLKQAMKLLLKSQREMSNSMTNMNNNITTILAYLFQQSENFREIIDLLKKN